MKRIITISREFGSGGRELGKRLSDEMHLPVYDHEIIEQLAEQHELSPDYISSLSEKPLQLSYSMTIGHRFTASYPASNQQLKLITAQEALIRELAEKDCIIIGRAADVILKDMHSFNVFVYADMASRINRCMERADGNENLAPAQLRRKITRIDKERASYHALFADTPWGKKESYHLCINTSYTSIKAIIPSLAQYIHAWYAVQEKHYEAGIQK